MMERVMCVVLGVLAVSGASAEPLEVFRDCDVCPEMIELPMGHPVPVDELDAANPWGLRHMSGNVREITLSCYPPDIKHLPAWKTTREWLEKSADEICSRVLRGGEFAGDMSRTRVAWRMTIKETLRAAFVGFRVVKEMN